MFYQINCQKIINVGNIKGQFDDALVFKQSYVFCKSYY